ncbi:MAG TPA: cyclic nucleotide-binding domain-containing protein [Anaerolineales bacterium]|nr:cyclic nucleotide-binding domain-containing protein [Anaerolineales bacterium]
MDARQEIAFKAEREVMACIGCHDCLLACPLPQANTVTIATLNYAVLQPEITDPAAIDFIMACTQCQQCVPVCPADLSRADMVLHNKIKIEDVAPDSEVMLQSGEHVSPSGWTVDRLAAHLTRFTLFDGVPPSELRRLMLKITLRRLKPGDALCREGEYHERLYVVLEGHLEQTTSGLGARRTRILVLGPGSFHGEMAVMANNPESYTLLALEKSVVIEIPKAALFQFMSQSPVFNATMTELYRRRAVWTHAARSPILSVLPEEALEEIINRAEMQYLQPGEVLHREGDAADHVYLLRNGFLRVSRKFQDKGDRVLLYFREGDVFGVRSMLSNDKRFTVTVSANTRVEIIRVAHSVFTQVAEKYPGAMDAVREKAMEAERAAPAEETASQNVHGRTVFGSENTTQLTMSWSTLIDQGVIQSHELLVIDQSICTNCNNCVEACERRHGYSRLERRGLQIDNLLFPTACRHCEDPVCLLCSVNGIVRLPNGEIAIVEDNCIGCGACAERCPYGNIQMHPVVKKRERNFLLELWEYTFGKPEEKQADQVTQCLAVKCDLCAGYYDYACITACPVGAAFRIDPVETFGRHDLLIGLEMKQKSK